MFMGKSKGGKEVKTEKCGKKMEKALKNLCLLIMKNDSENGIRLIIWYGAVLMADYKD